MNTRLSARYDSAPQLLPFDKERFRRRRARWSRVGQIVAVLGGSLAVAGMVALFLMLWLVRNEGQP